MEVSFAQKPVVTFCLKLEIEQFVSFAFEMILIIAFIADSSINSSLMADDGEIDTSGNYFFFFCLLIRPLFSFLLLSNVLL